MENMTLSTKPEIHDVAKPPDEDRATAAEHAKKKV